MKLCKGCNIEYENFATYSNDCNLDLDEGNSVSKPRALNDNAKLVLAIAKNNIIKSHQVLAFIQCLFIAFMFYLALSGTLSLSGVILPLILSAFPVIHIIISKGIKEDKSWAHTASTITGFIIILGFPIGTVIGFIMLRNTFKKEWKLIELD
ncbi:MAG: hypothetical protein ACJA2B_001541 [Candidatus Endobugula sp.]|jgi:hypothetical protein